MAKLSKKDNKLSSGIVEIDEQDLERVTGGALPSSPIDATMYKDKDGDKVKRGLMFDDVYVDKDGKRDIYGYYSKNGYHGAPLPPKH